MSQQSLKSTIVQKIIGDPNNSSTTNLSVANGFTFAGAATSTSDVSGLQITFYADQNCTVYVEQSPDATPHWDISDSYDYIAGQSFGSTICSISLYYRVRVVTLQNATTTVFRLQSALCPIISALPRALDKYGNLSTAIKSITDVNNFNINSTTAGELRVAEGLRLAGASTPFNGVNGVPDSNVWGRVLANSGTVTVAGGETLVSTNTTAANGSAMFISKARGRYVYGHTHTYKSKIYTVNAGAVGNTRKWGVAYGSTIAADGIATDGLWFQLIGTQFSIGIQYNNGAVSTVTSFNGKLGTTYTPDLTKSHEYRIKWDTYGVWFFVDDLLLHADLDGTAPHTATGGFHLHHTSTNSNGLQTNNELRISDSAILRYGKENTAKISSLVTTANTYNLKYNSGILHRVVIGNNGTLMTIYDDTTGTTTPLAIISPFSGQGSAFSPASLEFNVPFYAGLKVVTTGTWNATFVYE